MGRTGIMLGSDPLEKKGEDKLSKATKDSCKTTIEVIHGLMTQIIKNRLFNQVSCQAGTPTSDGAQGPNVGNSGSVAAIEGSGTDVAME